MRKTIYLLNIGEYESEITELTYPYIARYADKIGASIQMITERKFPDWDLDYEKLQIYELAEERGDHWSIYIDSDALIHPDMPDLTSLVPYDHVAHNGSDFAPIRWRYDRYFFRDGRHIGSANWLAMASEWCRDLWRPLDDMTPEEAVSNIFPTVKEQNGSVTASHLVSDYALSRNIARFGLKFTGIKDIWFDRGITKERGKDCFLFHTYNLDAEEKLEKLRAILIHWKLMDDPDYADV